jgi:hypothetical protein
VEEISVYFYVTTVITAEQIGIAVTPYICVMGARISVAMLGIMT